MFDFSSFLEVLNAGSAMTMLIVPLAVLQLLSLIFIPSLMAPGAKPKVVAKALYCYILQALGIVLMTIGVLPTLYSVFGGFAFTGSAYVALLVVFATGGLIFLWHEQLVRSVDSASRAVPAAIYFTTLRLVGSGLALLSALSLILLLIMGSASVPGWWVQPLTMLLYGLALDWFGRGEGSQNSVFQSVPMATPSVKPAAAAAPAARPKATKSVRRPAAKKAKKTVKKKK